jgi:hypothetical protein
MAYTPRTFADTFGMHFQGGAVPNQFAGNNYDAYTSIYNRMFPEGYSGLQNLGFDPKNFAPTGQMTSSQFGADPNAALGGLRDIFNTRENVAGGLLPAGSAPGTPLPAAQPDWMYEGFDANVLPTDSNNFQKWVLGAAANDVNPYDVFGKQFGDRGDHFLETVFGGIDDTLQGAGNNAFTLPTDYTQYTNPIVETVSNSTGSTVTQTDDPFAKYADNSQWMTDDGMFNWDFFEGIDPNKIMEITGYDQATLDWLSMPPSERQRITDSGEGGPGNGNSDNRELPTQNRWFSADAHTLDFYEWRDYSDEEIASHTGIPVSEVQRQRGVWGDYQDSLNTTPTTPTSATPTLADTPWLGQEDGAPDPRTDPYGYWQWLADSPQGLNRPTSAPGSGTGADLTKSLFGWAGELAGLLGGRSGFDKPVLPFWNPNMMVDPMMTRAMDLQGGANNRFNDFYSAISGGDVQGFMDAIQGGFSEGIPDMSNDPTAALADLFDRVTPGMGQNFVDAIMAENDMNPEDIFALLGESGLINQDNWIGPEGTGPDNWQNIYSNLTGVDPATGASIYPDAVSNVAAPTDESALRNAITSMAEGLSGTGEGAQNFQDTLVKNALYDRYGVQSAEEIFTNQESTVKRSIDQINQVFAMNNAWQGPEHMDALNRVMNNAFKSLADIENNALSTAYQYGPQALSTLSGAYGTVSDVDIGKYVAESQSNRDNLYANLARSGDMFNKQFAERNFWTDLNRANQSDQIMRNEANQNVFGNLLDTYRQEQDVWRQMESDAYNRMLMESQINTDNFVKEYQMYQDYIDNLGTGASSEQNRYQTELGTALNLMQYLPELMMQMGDAFSTRDATRQPGFLAQLGQSLLGGFSMATSPTGNSYKFGG